jgi:hypothetical protein
MGSTVEGSGRLLHLLQRSRSMIADRGSLSPHRAARAASLFDVMPRQRAQ